MSTEVPVKRAKVELKEEPAASEDKKPEKSSLNYEDDDEPIIKAAGFKRREHASSRHCPYLGTIERAVLDFDFEKLCSVSLSHLNVYACLVCGKYFQGRGTNTHAYTHALECNHHVFLNLHTLKFYCLPDDYEIIDSALDDIKFVCRPTYTKEHISQIDKSSKLVRAADDTTYRPGLLGLNNIKANDYCNVVLHALASVPALRNYFLREENYVNIKRPPGDKLVLLTQRFGELIRKIYNPRAFKSHVSPHEMLQAVVLCSEKRFQITKQGDSIECLSWLLNTLHSALNGTKKTSSSVVYRTFRGRMRSYTRKVLPAEITDDTQKLRLLERDASYQERVDDVPFLYLTLDLPPAPLYRDEHLQNIIPQVPLNVLLQKFNGVTEKEYKTYKDNFMKRFALTQLPSYLIICFKRFTKNNWYTEKNPTIVNFPIKNVDFYDVLAEDARPHHPYTTYDMVSNVVHDGKPESGTYRIQMLHRGTNKWFELEDLDVKEILPQMITLTESYIQVWQLNRTKTREERAGELHEENM